MRKNRISLTCALLALIATASQGATSLTQHGITWDFNTDRQTGQYANGDWWVVGPVTITNITPASTVTPSPSQISNIAVRIMNGSQINPPLGDAHGYDNAPGDMSYNPVLNAGRPGGNDLSPENPLIISSGSLISSISKTNFPSVNVNTNTGVVTLTPNRPQLKAAAILTVVTSAPTAGSFRPPPVGSDKTSYWNKTNLNYSILKSLPPPTNMPALATVAVKFERPWLEQNPGWPARYIHPEDNQPTYGREIAHTLTEGLLSLHMNYTPAQKETLYIRLVQYGIDVYGTAKAGGKWEDLGGHNPGRKMPLILAGMALNDTNILVYANAAKQFIFQEDRQTWYVTQYDVGRVLYTNDSRPRIPYIQADVGIPEWGEQHARNQTRDGRNWDAYYRSTCNAVMTGQALAARLTSGAVSLWNWPAFFDYIDRVFVIDGPNASPDANTIQPYVANTWRSYRNLSDADGDGLLDSWEAQHFGGATNANPSALAANGLNTIYETYVAGLNPANTQSVFALSGQQTATQSKLQWGSVSGRVYSIYWTTNLLNGFQPLETNILWPQNSWTNSVHGTQADGFYKIKVQLRQ